MASAEGYAKQGNWGHVRLNLGPARTIARRNKVPFGELYGARTQEIVRIYMRTRLAQGEEVLDKAQKALAQGASGVRNFAPSYNNFSRTWYGNLYYSIINAAREHGVEQEARELISAQAERFVDVARSLGKLRTNLGSGNALFEAADYIQRQYV